jgi:outer membrane protein OmpA-like peptidoglycan-associated protein
MMNVNLVDKVKGYLSPDIIRTFGLQLGETPEATQRGLNSAIPAVMGGFARKASTDPSGAGIERILTDAPRDGEKLEDLPSMIASRTRTDALIGKSQGMLGGLFGDRLSSAVDQVATTSGVGPKSAGKILAIAAPLVGAVVRREAGVRHLNAGGVATMLSEQKSAVASALGGSGVTSIFGAGGWTEDDTRPPVQSAHAERGAYGTTPEGKPAGRRIGMPFIVLGALILLGLLYLFGRRREPLATTPEPAPQVEVPRVGIPGAPAMVIGGAGSAIVELNRFFDDPTQATPMRIPLEGVTFDHDSNRISAAGMDTLHKVAATLQSHSSANVRIDGYTDDSGNPEYNTALSTERANAVRDALVRDGVDPQRISVVGNGAANPVATNDTAEGRAANRRIELVVTSR